MARGRSAGVKNCFQSEVVFQSMSAASSSVNVLITGLQKQLLQPVCASPGMEEPGRSEPSRTRLFPQQPTAASTLDLSILASEVGAAL